MFFYQRYTSFEGASSRGQPLNIFTWFIGSGGLIALQTPRTCRFPAFEYCQVVNRQLLRLLRTYILVEYRVILNYIIKSSNILYHWQLSMDSFRFCQTCLLHIKPFVVNNNAIFPFLGGSRDVTSHNSREYFREWLRESLRSGKSHSLPLLISDPPGGV